MKTSAKILTGLACLYLMIMGAVNLAVRFPQHIDLSKLTFTSIYFIPKITYIIYILLSVFVLAKLVFYKQPFIHKTVGLILVISGFLQIATIAVYYCNFRIYSMISSTAITAYQYYLLIAEHLSYITIDLLIILICINAFKSFIKSKTAFIMSLCVFALKTVIYFTTIFTQTYFFPDSARYIMMTIAGSLFINAASFWGGYMSLKPYCNGKIV